MSPHLQKYTPLDLRVKKTRAMRRTLTKNQVRRSGRGVAVVEQLTGRHTPVGLHTGSGAWV